MRRRASVHGRNVVLVHVERAIELPHVERVAVVVLARRREVERLHRVPA